MSKQHNESRIVPRKVLNLLDSIDEVLLETVCQIGPGLSDNEGATVESVVLRGAMVLQELGPLEIPDEQCRDSLLRALEVSYPAGSNRPQWAISLEAAIKGCMVPGRITRQQIGLTAAQVLQTVLEKPCNRNPDNPMSVHEVRVYSQWYDPESRPGGHDPVVVRINRDGVYVVTANDALDLLASAEGVTHGKGANKEAKAVLVEVVQRISGTPQVAPSGESETIELRAERLEARMRERGVCGREAEEQVSEWIFRESDRQAIRLLNGDRTDQLQYLIASGVSDQELISRIDALPLERTSAA